MLRPIVRCEVRDPFVVMELSKGTRLTEALPWRTGGRWHAHMLGQSDASLPSRVLRCARVA